MIENYWWKCRQFWLGRKIFLLLVLGYENRWFGEWKTAGGVSRNVSTLIHVLIISWIFYDVSNVTTWGTENASFNFAQRENAGWMTCDSKNGMSCVSLYFVATMILWHSDIMTFSKALKLVLVWVLIERSWRDFYGLIVVHTVMFWYSAENVWCIKRSESRRLWSHAECW